MYATTYLQYAVLVSMRCIHVYRYACMYGLWRVTIHGPVATAEDPEGFFVFPFFFSLSYYFPTITVWPGWLVSNNASMASIIHCILNVSCPIHPLLHTNLNIWLDILTCSAEWAPPVAADPLLLLLLLLSALCRVLTSVAASFHFVLASKTVMYLRCAMRLK